MIWLIFDHVLNPNVPGVIKRFVSIHRKATISGKHGMQRVIARQCSDLMQSKFPRLRLTKTGPLNISLELATTS
jgi:hypothetical protein